MRKYFALLLIPALAALTLTGCAPAPTAAPAAPEKPAALKKITVLLDYTPNTNHTGLYAAKDLKYYEAEGLDVDIVQSSAGSPVEAVAAGKAAFGVSYQEEVTFARTADKPLPVKAIAAVIQHNTSGFASKKASNIVTPKDFEGKTYGGWGSPVEPATLKALMDMQHGDFAKVKMADIGELDFFAAMENHIDFTWIFYGWDGIAAQVKNYPINFIKMTDIDKNLDYYTPVLITNEAQIKNDPELVRKFLRATAKGYQYAIDKPDDAAAILLKSAPELDKKLVVASQQYLSKAYAPDGTWGVMKEDIWKNYAGWMLDHKLLTKPLNVPEAYTNEYLPK